MLDWPPLVRELADLLELEKFRVLGISGGAPYAYVTGCAMPERVPAIAVVSAGTVGFVGLITPHAVRLTFRTSDHRIVAPAAALFGGTLLAAADLVARTIASPRQLPVGASMALVGAPLFIALLKGRR